MDHATLATMRDRHHAWRLLASLHAPLVASFLHRVFVAPNVRLMSEYPAGVRIFPQEPAGARNSPHGLTVGC